MENRSAFALSGFVLVVATQAAAQTVWPVPGYQDIPATLAAASPGDVLVLNGSTTYEPFLLDKGVTIEGNGARVGPGPQSTMLGVDIDVPPGEQAYLRDLDLRLGYSPFGSGGCQVTVLDGAVAFEDCLFGHEFSTALEVLGGAVTVRGGIARHTRGGRPAIRTTATMVLDGVTVLGGDATCDYVFGCSSGGWSASPAIEVAAGVVHAANCEFHGGAHLVGSGSFNGVGAPGVSCLGGSTFLVDCVITGGDSAAMNGGVGIASGVGTTVVATRCTVTGGSPNAAPTTGTVSTNAVMPSLAVTPAWTRAQLSTVSIRGLSNAAYLLALAPDLMPTRPWAGIPGVAVPIWAVSGQVVSVGTLSGSGAAALAVPVPNIPALQWSLVRVQALSYSGQGIGVSPVCGAMVR